MLWKKKCKFCGDVIDGEDCPLCKEDKSEKEEVNLISFIMEQPKKVRIILIGSGIIIFFTLLFVLVPEFNFYQKNNLKEFKDNCVLNNGTWDDREEFVYCWLNEDNYFEDLGRINLEYRVGYGCYRDGRDGKKERVQCRRGIKINDMELNRENTPDNPDNPDKKEKDVNDVNDVKVDSYLSSVCTLCDGKSPPLKLNKTGICGLCSKNKGESKN